MSNELQEFPSARIKAERESHEDVAVILISGTETIRFKVGKAHEADSPSKHLFGNQKKMHFWGML